jgi:ribose/xylose/arabinose/galactoside ABC-type transport system permease subunit
MSALSRQVYWLSRQGYWGARTILAWGLAIATFVAFSIVAPHFFSLGNLYALIQIFGSLALVSTGLAVVMLAGEFDLSIVGTFPLAGLVVIEYADRGLAVSFFLAVVIGIAYGLVNGWIVGALRIPSIAVTVATMMLSIGFGYLVSHNDFVSMRDYQVSLELTQPILKVLSWQSIIELMFVAIAVVAVKRTRWGRYLYAIGGDSRKARASGLPVTKTLIGGFVVCAGFTTLAGVLQGISLASSTPGPNDDCLLQAATAVLIGGVALSGGRGSLVGVAGGAFLLSVVSSGLGIAGISSSTIELVNGAILAGVVACDRPLARLVHRRAEEMRADDNPQPLSRPAPSIEAPIEPVPP